MTCSSINVSGGAVPGGAGTIWEVRLSVYAVWGTDFTEAVLTDLANLANPMIKPLGYNFQKATFQWDSDTMGTASLWYQETGTVAILAAITPLFEALTPFFWALGFLLLGIAVYEWVQNSSKLSDTQAQTAADAEKTLTQQYNAGKITYDQYMAGLKAIQDELRAGKTDWGSIALIVGAVLGIAYVGGEWVKGSRSRSRA